MTKLIDQMSDAEASYRKIFGQTVIERETAKSIARANAMTTTKPTDQEIEHVARAMCAACGEDPDKPRWDEIPQGEKWWECWKDDAMEFLGAYRAMQEWQ